MILKKMLAVLKVFQQCNEAGEQQVVVWDEGKQAWVPIGKVEEDGGIIKLMPTDGYTAPNYRDHML